MNEDRFEMLYCDDMSCRVNEFERGTGNSAGHCPGCESRGLPIPTR